MITLITGTPGSGKTSWLINELLELRKNQPDREIFVHGIRNFRGFAHETIYCKSQLCDICRSKDLPHDAKFVENWPLWKTVGSLIVVDEVQRIWRPRAGAGAVPESVSGLETHRHYGLDFWIISQGPHLFDAFIRLLVGRHIHLVSRWNGRTQYEWPECKQNTSATTDAVVRGYTLPKHVYKYYDSAEVHTKQNHRKPLAFYIFIFVVLVVLALSYFAYTRIQSRMHPEKSASVPVSQSNSPPLAGSVFPVSVPSPVSSIPASLDYYYHQLSEGFTSELAHQMPENCHFDRKVIKCTVSLSQRKKLQNTYCDEQYCYAFFSPKPKEPNQPPNSNPPQLAQN